LKFQVAYERRFAVRGRPQTWVVVVAPLEVSNLGLTFNN